MNPERSKIVFNQNAGNGEAKEMAAHLSKSLNGARVVPFAEYLTDNNHALPVDVVWSLGGDGSHTSIARISRNGNETPRIIPLNLGTAGIIPKKLGTDKRWWGFESATHYVKRMAQTVRSAKEVTIYPGTVEFSDEELRTWLWTICCTGYVGVPFMDTLEKERGKTGRFTRLGRAFARTVRSLHSHDEPIEISVSSEEEKVYEAMIMKHPLIPGGENMSRGENDALWTVPATERNRLRLVTAVLRDTARILFGHEVTGTGIVERSLTGSEEIIFPASTQARFGSRMGIDSELYHVSGPVTIYSRRTNLSPYRLLVPIVT